jgi:hypothetical protein
METTPGYESVSACGNYIKENLFRYSPFSSEGLVRKVKKHSEPDEDGFVKVSGESYTIYQRRIFRRNIPLLTVSSEFAEPKLELHDQTLRGAMFIILGLTEWKGLLATLSNSNPLS